MPFLDYTGLTTFWNKVKDILAGKQNTLTAGEGVTLENNTLSLQEPIKEVTKVQYDALTEEQKNTGLYVVTDTSINLDDHGDIYSTDETRIGTWIDGKPIYRKVIRFGDVTLPPKTDLEAGGINITSPDSANLSIDNYIGVTLAYKGFTSDYLSYTQDIGISYRKSLDNFYIYQRTSSGEYVLYDVFAIMDYTKTTDPTPTVSSITTQSLNTDSSVSTSQSTEKVLSAKIPLPSYASYAPASASSASISFTPASASSAKLTL